MSLVVVFGSICLLLWLIQLYTKSKNKNDPPKLANSLPIIGHSMWLINTRTDDLYHLMQTIAEQTLAVGGVGSIRIGPMKAYVITDPQMTGTIMNTCLQKDKVYHLYDAWLGKGLFMLPKCMFKNRRRTLYPAFHLRQFDYYLEVFNKEARNFVKTLNKRAGMGPFDASNDVAVYNLRSFCQTFFDDKIDDDQMLLDYITSSGTWHETAIEAFLHSLLHIQSLTSFFGINSKHVKLLGVLKVFARRLLDKKLAYRKAHNITAFTEENDTSGRPKLFIDLLIDLNERGELADQHLEDEVNAFLFAGQDTTAGNLLFLLVLIGSYPEVQEKLYQELYNFYGDADVNVSKEDLPKFEYLEAVIKETMRVYPFVFFFGRVLEEDLKYDKYTLHAGTRCFIMTSGVHMHESWGPDRAQFIPERWLDPARIPQCQSAYIPFGYGKRICIGKPYDLTSMKVSLIYLVRNFKLKGDHTKMTLKFESMLKPRSGHEISIEKRIKAD